MIVSGGKQKERTSCYLKTFACALQCTARKYTCVGYTPSKFAPCANLDKFHDTCRVLHVTFAAALLRHRWFESSPNRRSDDKLSHTVRGENSSYFHSEDHIWFPRTCPGCSEARTSSCCFISDPVDLNPSEVYFRTILRVPRRLHQFPTPVPSREPILSPARLTQKLGRK